MASVNQSSTIPASNASCALPPARQARSAQTVSSISLPATPTTTASSWADSTIGWRRSRIAEVHTITAKLSQGLRRSPCGRACRSAPTTRPLIVWRYGHADLRLTADSETWLRFLRRKPISCGRCFGGRFAFKDRPSCCLHSGAAFHREWVHRRSLCVVNVSACLASDSSQAQARRMILLSQCPHSWLM
jgi:hypothetical protein